MSKKDIDKVVSALETLEELNQKYHKPYGDNPMGIAVYVYKLLKKGGDKNGLTKAGPTA